MNKFLSLILLSLLSLAVCAQQTTDAGSSIVAAPNIPEATNFTAVNSDLFIGEFSNLTVSSGIFAVVAIVSGLVMVFLGNRLFRPILFIAGFYFGAILGFVILQNIEYGSHNLVGGSHRDLVYLIVCLLIGGMFGGLVVLFWKLGFILLGLVLGYALGMFLLTALQTVLTTSTAHTAILIICVIAGGILIHFFEKPALIIGTSVAGAFSVFVGLDLFVNAGFLTATLEIAHGQGTNANIGSKWIYMLIGAVILSLIGISHQFHQLRASKGVHHGLMERDRLQNPKDYNGLPLNQNQNQR